MQRTVRGGVVGSAVFLLAVLLGVAPVAAQTIVVWDWEPPEVMEKYRPMIERFQQETGIRVEYQQVPWAEMKDKTAVAIAGGAPPDLVRISSRWGDTLAEQGLFTDLRPYLERFEGQYKFSDFFPASVNLWTAVDGSVYALGNDLDIVALFFNRELFEAQGLEEPYAYDWNQWYDAARKLTRDTDGDGTVDQFGMTNWWFHWHSLVWANGGSTFRDDRTTHALGSPQAREALEFYRRFFQDRLMPAMADSQALGYPHPAAHWKAGRIGMAPAGAWMPNYWVWDQQAGAYAFDFDVAHMPVSPAGQRATTLEGSGYGIPVNAANKDAAFRFLAFITSQEWQMTYALTGFPSRRTAAEAAFAQPGEPRNKAIWVEVTGYARPFPKGVDWWGRTAAIINRHMSQFFAGNVSLEQALTAADEELRPVLAEILGRK